MSGVEWLLPVDTDFDHFVWVVLVLCSGEEKDKVRVRKHNQIFSEELNKQSRSYLLLSARFQS